MCHLLQWPRLKPHENKIGDLKNLSPNELYTICALLSELEAQLGWERKNIEPLKSSFGEQVVSKMEHRLEFRLTFCHC